jgi:predicted small secreted protein
VANSAHQGVFAIPGRAHHVWAVTVVKTPMHEHLEVLVDAVTGEILRITNQVRHG